MTSCHSCPSSVLCGAPGLFYCALKTGKQSLWRADTSVVDLLDYHVITRRIECRLQSGFEYRTWHAFHNNCTRFWIIYYVYILLCIIYTIDIVYILYVIYIMYNIYYI